MENQDQNQDLGKLPPELRAKLLEVEIAAEAEERNNTYLRFNKVKGFAIGGACAILAFTIGILLRSTMANALIFALLMGVFGFLTAAFQRVKK